MNWLENILIIAGISLDMLASMEVQGAMLQKIQRKKLLLVTTFVVLLQCLFFYGGYFAGFWVSRAGQLRDVHEEVGYVISSMIFLFLGVRLLIKAIRREFIDECRKEITIGQYVRIIAVSSIYTIFAGAGCEMIETNLIFMLFMIIIFSFFAVFCGIYVGYHFGFEAKTKIYIIGTVILLFTGAEILVRYVILR